MTYLKSITLQNFKSIFDLSHFDLNPGINILIGKNGAGKSNFIDFFKVIQKYSWNTLNEYVIKMGGATTFLFQGGERSSDINVKLELNNSIKNQTFKIKLISIFNNIFMQFPEYILSKTQQGQITPQDSEHRPSIEHNTQDESFINDTIRSWRIYHFRNTSTFSPLRHEASVYNNKEFLPDGSNLSAYLLTIKNNHNDIYQRIRQLISYYDARI
ncbi:MAG: AAA family ATPase [Deltaproteobacteria bacterium]|nr:AAA family ATPase [Deltaproteobacteria bacterium]